MNLKHYPKHDGSGFTPDEVRKNLPIIYTDVICPFCEKLQPVAATHYLGGPCIRCGKLTGAMPPPPKPEAGT